MSPFRTVPARAVGSPCLRAALVAGVGGAVPSTAHALLTGRDALEATRAAGTLLLPADAPPARLLVAGVLAHAALSAGWTMVLTPALRTARRPLLRGAALGAAVAGLDLAVARRAFPRIAALPTGPQVADHVLFGVLVAAADRGGSDRHAPAAPTGHQPVAPGRRPRRGRRR